VITGRPVTIGVAFATGAPHLMPLPGEPFDPARLLQARVDNRARVSVRQCFYSVPARYAGRSLAVRLAARTVEIYQGPTLVATHERAVGRYVEVLTLDHYLEVLKIKPGGLPGATALAQAKTSKAFTGSHQAYWDAARRHSGDAAGTRALIEILLAHRTMPAAALTTAMDRAVAAGCLDPQVLLIDGRRDTTQPAPVVAIGALARYDRPAPTLNDYAAKLTADRGRATSELRRDLAHRLLRPDQIRDHRPLLQRQVATMPRLGGFERAHSRIVHRFAGGAANRASIPPPRPGPPVDPHHSARLGVRHALSDQPTELLLLLSQSALTVRRP